MQAEELADEGGHHGEEADILLELDLVLEQSVHVEHADGVAVQGDGYADEGYAAALDPPRACLVQEKRFLLDVRHIERFPCLENAPGHPLVKTVYAVLPLLGCQAVGGVDEQVPGLRVVQGDGGPLHG